MPRIFHADFYFTALWQHNRNMEKTQADCLLERRRRMYILRALKGGEVCRVFFTLIFILPPYGSTIATWKRRKQIAFLKGDGVCIYSEP